MFLSVPCARSGRAGVAAIRPASPAGVLPAVGDLAEPGQPGADGIFEGEGRKMSEPIASEKVPGYADTLTLRNVGMLSGKFTIEVTPGDGNMPWDSDIVKAFLADQDLMEMTLVSTCVGFVKTLTKQFNKRYRLTDR